jgi:hypothetical protein
MKELRDRFLDQLISNFGDDEGNEVVFNATVVQALMMMNSGDINDLIAPKDKGKGTVENVIAKRGHSSSAIIRDLYLAALNRPPTPREMDKITRALSTTAVRDTNPYAPYQDIFWALVNSNEFILNH